ncbi:MAG: DUF167 domain-containing protein [Bryobacterales bacterium]|nr:DUF167 domain-containing protein [Bryobacterales bacterium]
METAELHQRLRAEGVITLKLKVIPKSPKSEMAGWMADGSLKVRVAAAPEKGRANAELCAFLAGEFRVPRKNVELIAGESSHHKTVRISAR